MLKSRISQIYKYLEKLESSCPVIYLILFQSEN